MDPISSIVNVLLGGMLLAFGRKLFWLLVGGVGFIIGVQIADRLIHGNVWVTLIVGLVLGIILAGVAIFLEKLAIGLVGFLGGGYILLSIAGFFHIGNDLISLAIFIVGGILGSILIASIVDWALILISVLIGASMIVRALAIQQVLFAGLTFVVLIAAGIIIQASALRREKHHPVEREEQH